MPSALLPGSGVGRRRGRHAVAVVLTAAAALFSSAAPATAGPAEPDLVAMANAARAAAGVPALVPRDDLTAVARGWSERMAREGRLSHNPAVGSQVCCWQGLAENVGYSSSGAPDVHRRFLESTAHRANLLDRRHSHVGIGTAVDSRGRIWVTQVFRTPTSAAAVPGVGPVGAIRDRWLALGAERSPIGAPVTGELVAPDQVGRYTHFRTGSIYWSPRSGAHEVYGSIRDRWTGMRWEAGPLGYPTTGEVATPDRRGRYNHFQGGSIYWTPTTGAHAVYGAIRHRWAAERWEAGRLGYPTRSEYDVPGGRASDFERGRIVWDRATGAIRVELR